MEQHTVAPLGSANVEAFCREVYAQNYELAGAGLVNILHAMEVGGIGLRTVGSREESVRIQSMLASAITAMLADPGLNLSPQGVSALMALKSQLRTLFASSAFEDMSHVAAILGDRLEGIVRYGDERLVTKYLLVCTLDYASEDTVDYIKGLEPSLRLLFWLGCLDTRLYVAEREDRLRKKCLTLTSDIENCAANSIAEIQMLNRVWMNCSYWSYPDKHKVKKTLNKVLRNTLGNLGVRVPSELGNVKRAGKPRVLVITEVWTSSHSMYRCYANAIASLREKFDVVGLSLGATCDEAACEIFHESHQFEYADPIQSVVDKVAAIGADIIYFPSLGMQQTVLQLAQLRSAPIQLMTAGHPASSFSDEIDYMVLEQDMLSDPDTISETILLTKSDAFSYRRLPVAIPEKNFSKEQTVNVAISSIFYKLSSDFVKTLEEIDRQVEVDVHFHFLAGLNAMNRIPFERELESLRHVTCHELVSYDKYLEIISCCDLQLAPFPFGNANGFADAMLVGLPIVCLDGAEIHSHTDAALARRIGVPAACVTSAIEEYKERAIEFIVNGDLRGGIATQIAEIDLSETLFGENTSGDRNDFAELLVWLNANRDSVKDRDRKVWSVQDRQIVLGESSGTVE